MIRLSLAAAVSTGAEPNDQPMRMNRFVAGKTVERYSMAARTSAVHCRVRAGNR